jgi:hypothetical protein
MNPLIQEFDYEEILMIQQAADAAAIYNAYLEIQEITQLDTEYFLTDSLDKQERKKLKKEHFDRERLHAIIRQIDDPLFIRK